MQQTFSIVWIVLAVSQAIYLVIPLPSQVAGSRPADLLPLVLAGVALVQAVAIAAWLRLRAFQPIARGTLDPATPEGARQLFTVLILAWVLAESISIYGLTLRLLNAEQSWWLAFMALGALMLFHGRPWQARISRAPTSADLARSNTPID